MDGSYYHRSISENGDTRERREESSEPSNHSHYVPSKIAFLLLHKYLRLMYYVGVVPLKFKLDSTILTKQRNWFQMTICLFFAIFGGLTRIKGIRQLTIFLPSDGKVRNPVEYFEAAEQISLGFYYFAILLTLWMRSDEFVKILNLSHSMDVDSGKVPESLYGSRTVVSNIQLKQPGFIVRHQVLIWISAWLFYCTFSFIITNGVYIEHDSSNFDIRWRIMSDEGRVLVFVPNEYGAEINTYASDPNFKFNATSSSDPLFIGLQVFSYFAEQLIQKSADVLLIILAFVFYLYIREFSIKLCNTNFYHKIMRNDDEGKSILYLDSVLDDFEQIRQLVKEINCAIGLLAFALTLGSLPNFITDFLQMLSPQSAWTFFKSFMYFACLFTFIGISAKANKKAQILGEWLSCRKNYLMIKSTQPNSFGIAEFLAIQSAAYLGISGGGFFIITTEFLGAWISLMLTFAIIILELRSN